MFENETEERTLAEEMGRAAAVAVVGVIAVTAAQVGLLYAAAKYAEWYDKKHKTDTEEK